MIDNIKIVNFAHVDELAISFESGLNIITGETGAGKSMLIDAILFAMGARAQSSIQKDKSKATTVTLTLSLDKNFNADFDEFCAGESNLIFRRVLDSSGKSKLYLNDIPITAARAKYFQSQLLEISSQHDGINLTETTQQTELYDLLAGVSRQNYQTHYSAYKSIKSELEELKAKNMKLDIEISFITSMLNDLKSLGYSLGEETQLLEKRKFAQDRYKIDKAIVLGEEIVDQVSLSVSQLDRELQRAAAEHFADEIALLSQIWNLNNELSLQLKNKNKLQESQSLEEIDDRLHAIRAVSRKYNLVSDTIPQQIAKLEAELDLLKNIDVRIKAKEGELQSHELKVQNEAKLITDKRAGYTSVFEDSINEQLQQLHLANAKFMVKFEQNNEPGEYGNEKVRFLIKTNVDTSFEPIENIASGGELSRLFLALKSMIANDDSHKTLIFDEIDSGFSGKVSYSVGRKLKNLSKMGQTLVITHQPQVAAFGDNHILIIKAFQEGSTKVSAVKLKKDEVEAEIARMISGDVVTEVTLQAARSLMNDAA